MWNDKSLKIAGCYLCALKRSDIPWKGEQGGTRQVHAKESTGDFRSLGLVERAKHSMISQQATRRQLHNVSDLPLCKTLKIKMQAARPLAQRPVYFRQEFISKKHVVHVAAASKIEIVPYTPIQKTDKYDLRLIQPHTVVSTPYQRRDEGFLLLGGYLSGNNAKSLRCLETQPVVMTFRPDGFKIMQIYVVPGETELSTGDEPLPAPTEQGVELDAAGGELIAAMRFEGNATKEVCESMRDTLLKCLEKDGLNVAEAEGFRLAQYGPLHSLSTRINEIWLTVKV